jgi:hypothetical protein
VSQDFDDPPIAIFKPPMPQRHSEIVLPLPFAVAMRWTA